MALPRAIAAFTREAEPLAPHTTMRLGGPARWFARPRGPEEARSALVAAAQAGLPVFVLGGGSNCLFLDDGFPGLVLSTQRLRGLTRAGDLLSVGAGYPTEVLVRKAVDWGLEEYAVLAGIPGSIGGAARMNAGGAHGDLGSLVQSVELLTEMGEREVRPRERIAFGYRSSGLEGQVVLGVHLRARPGDPQRAKARFLELRRAKAATQPLAERSAGCIFKNPPGGRAGALLDAAGLKGQRQGAFVISTRHANFIVHEGGGRAEDLLALIARARARVYERFGLALELEVRCGGDVPLPFLEHV